MKVILATDGSEHSEEAAWLLAHLPHSEPLELTVVSVFSTSTIPRSIETSEWIRREMTRRQDDAHAACASIEQMFEGANVTLNKRVIEGHASKAIVKLAEEQDADLVVLGARGQTLLERMVLGSVSDFVATHAHCSVLVVRPVGLDKRHHGCLHLGIAYDASEPSQFSLSQIENFNWKENTVIDVVSVFASTARYVGHPLPEDVPAIQQAMRSISESAVERLRQICPDVEQHVIEANHLGDGIVQFAKDHEIDLLVMGDTGSGLLGKFLLGSVSRYVLRHAGCSVWIARPKNSA